jgi:hypothetical protein
MKERKTFFPGEHTAFLSLTTSGTPANYGIGPRGALKYFNAIAATPALQGTGAKASASFGACRDFWCSRTVNVPCNNCSTTALFELTNPIRTFWPLQIAGENWVF